MVLVPTVYPTSRIANTLGALTSNHSFFEKGSTLTKKKKNIFRITFYAADRRIQPSIDYYIGGGYCLCFCRVHLLFALALLAGEALVLANRHGFRLLLRRGFAQTRRHPRNYHHFSGYLESIINIFKYDYLGYRGVISRDTSNGHASGHRSRGFVMEDV